MEDQVESPVRVSGDLSALQTTASMRDVEANCCQIDTGNHGRRRLGEMTSFLTVPKTPCGECLIPSKIPVIVVPQFTPRTEIMCFCCPPASSPIYHGARVTPAECPHS